MNITQENIDALNAVVKVKLEPNDYTEKVDQALKNYQKKAAMPGFRPGKVPSSLVKKMYGKTILAEEVNRLLSDNLYKYITDNKLDILGNPLPKEEVNNAVELDLGKEFEFHFDMALAPAFNVDLGKSGTLTEYTVCVDDKLINNYVQDITRRYGQVAPADTAGDGDLLMGDFVELDANGEIVPGGIFKSSTIFLDNPAKDHHKVLVGAKVDDKFDLTTEQIADNINDLASKLGVEPHAAEGLKNKFRFTVKTISRLVPAEMNQELFDKIYGPGAVTSEDDFRQKIAGELSSMFVRETEQKLRNDIRAALLKATPLTLPDEFLKRWLMAANEKPITPEQLEAEYPTYAEQLKWQLIENKLIRENDIKVTAEEATEHVKGILKENFARYGRNPDEVSEDELNDTARRVLSKEDEAKRIFEDMYAQRLMTLYKMKCTIHQKEVSYEEFLAA
jgi:trigger factor